MKRAWTFAGWARENVCPTWRRYWLTLFSVASAILALGILWWAVGSETRASAGEPGSGPAQVTSVYTTTVVDITFTSSWDGTLQRASLALPEPMPTTPVPVVIYLHGMFSCYRQQAPHRDAAETIGPLVAQRGWIFAAPELHGERPVPLPGDPWDPAAGCPQPVSVGYRPMGARPAQRDVLDTLSYVQVRYNVDPARVYLLSESAGGLTLLTTLAKFADRFAAAVAYASPTDLARWLREDSQAYPNIWREVGGLPSEVPFAYARRSPLAFALNLTYTPLMLVHGRQDTRVPVGHARDLYEAIRAARADAPVFLREYEGDHSGPFDPNDPDFVSIAEALDWFASFQLPAPPVVVQAVTDADEQEQGPYRFWWAGWQPLPGPERWVTVTVTRSETLVSGVVSDAVGMTFTLDLEALGWPNKPITVVLKPALPSDPVTHVVTPSESRVRFTLPAGRVVFTAMAPPSPPTTGTVWGIVFEDVNGNGVYDAGEAGVAGSVVTLQRDNARVASFVTGPDGRYRFDGLAPGVYLVMEEHPRCYAQSTVSAYLVTVAAGEVVERNFGHWRQWCAWFPTLER